MRRGEKVALLGQSESSYRTRVRFLKVSVEIPLSLPGVTLDGGRGGLVAPPFQG
uniref:Uncharacterized protein n=1 Tax=Anguilla anguilla TaxID=7936 RepID=A0A0E9Q3Y9_ANGAN